MIGKRGKISSYRKSHGPPVYSQIFLLQTRQIRKILNTTSYVILVGLAITELLIVPQVWHWDGNRPVFCYAPSKEKQARNVVGLDTVFLNTGSRFLSFRKKVQDSKYLASYYDQRFY